MISHEVIVNLIANTTTKTGLKIEAEIDSNLYPKGLRVTDEELDKSTFKKLTSTATELHHSPVVVKVDAVFFDKH